MPRIFVGSGPHRKGEGTPLQNGRHTHPKPQSKGFRLFRYPKSRAAQKPTKAADSLRLTKSRVSLRLRVEPQQLCNMLVEAFLSTEVVDLVATVYCRRIRMAADHAKLYPGSVSVFLHAYLMPVVRFRLHAFAFVADGFLYRHFFTRYLAFIRAQRDGETTGSLSLSLMP